MTEYLDALEPDTTMAGVLQDIYGDAQALVGRIDGLRVAAHGPDSDIKTIPGLALVMDWTSTRGRQDETLSTTHLSTLTDLGRRALLSVSATKNDVTVKAIKPGGVRGYRDLESNGDYYLGLAETGLVECVLKADGLPEEERAGSEPVGRYAVPTWRKVAELTPDKTDRLRVITSSLRDNMAVVELIMEGVDPEEALVAVSRGVA